MKPDLLDLLGELWRHLPRRRKHQFGLLLILVLFSSVSEMVSLGAVIPFLGALIAPTKLFNHPVVLDMAMELGITSPGNLVLPLVVLFILASVVAGGTRILLLWCTTKLAFATGADLSFDIYCRTLHLPYRTHLECNSSEVISTITRKVDGAVIVLYMTLSLVSSSILLLSILILLLVINATVALAATAGFGSIYFLISRFFRNRLDKNAINISKEQTQVIKALQEGLGGIRDILLDGTQPYYCNVYRRADCLLKSAMGDNIFIAGSPRFIMESLGMVLIAVLAYTLSRQSGGIGSALPIMGALALGAQRILPVLQQGFISWVNIAGNRASLEETLKFLDQPLPKEALEPVPVALSFRNSIRFENVRFRYTSNGPWVLDGIDLNIRKGAKIGFVGSTGSGKSTLLDLLMGMIDPIEGKILVDDTSLNEASRRAWQRTIAHVPQNIYLADATLAENIAFGIDRERINMVQLRTAAKQACIADFIESRPEGYDAFVGERGIRLSGGQRQRIGIARALYKQATVLVFDEATSALDNATEQEVMNAVENLGCDLTILIIAHRLSTVKQCDMLVELGQGQIVAQGNFEHLLKHSQSFRAMVNINT